MVLSLGSPPVRHPADVLLLLVFTPLHVFVDFTFLTSLPCSVPFPSSATLLSPFIRPWFPFWNYVGASHRCSFSSFITAGDACLGYLTGGLQDTKFPRRTETVKMNEVCSPPLVVFLFQHPRVDAYRFGFRLDVCRPLSFHSSSTSAPHILSELLVTGETSSAQVARIRSASYDSLLPTS